MVSKIERAPHTFLQKMQKRAEKILPTLTTLKEFGILAISLPFMTRTKPSRKTKFLPLTLTDQGEMQQSKAEIMNRIGQLLRKSPRWLTPTQARNEIAKRYGAKMLRAIENHTYSGTPPAEVTALLRIANSTDSEIRLTKGKANFNEVLADVLKTR